MNDKATLQKFKKIFESTQLDKIKPIDWQKSIASLRYFIKQFPFENKYKITAYCFTHNGTKLTHSQINNAKQVGTKDKDVINNIFILYPFQK